MMVFLLKKVLMLIAKRSGISEGRQFIIRGHVSPPMVVPLEVEPWVEGTNHSTCRTMKKLPRSKLGPIWLKLESGSPFGIKMKQSFL